MDLEFVFNNGDRVKDVISGLQGIVVSRSESLYGCNRYWVSPEKLKDEKPVDGHWFDEDQLTLVKAGAIAPRKRVGALVQAQAPLRRTGGIDLPSPSSNRSR